MADSFKDLDPFEEANSDLKFTLAKTLTRSQADKPLAIGGSNCPVPYGRSTKVPQTVEQKREALARILGKPVNKPTFPATVVPKDRCEAHSTSVDDRKSDFGGSNISVMPPGLRPALVPSVPNLMDEPVPSNQGKKSAWSGTPALSSKRLVLKGSAKEPVPKSSVPAPDASVNSNTDQEQASSVKAPMNTWLGRKGFVTADPRKTLSKEAPESSSDPNRGNVWRTATVDSCTKDSVEKSLRLLKITRNSEQAASKRDAAQPLLDGSEFDYPSLGSERSTQAPSGGALRSKFNANGGKTLLDESEIGYPATRDTKPELANIWDASAKSSSAISSAKSKMIANVWGEKMVDLSELDPFKTGSVRKENMPIKRDSATSESWRKPPVAKPTRKQPAPLAEKEKKPSKVEAKKAAPPASTAANRFALLMDGNEEGDEDAKDAQNDDGGDEMSTGGTGTSGRVHVSWW